MPRPIRTTAPVLYLRGTTYWLRFSHGGKQYRLPTGHSDKAKAEIAGQEKWAQIVNSTFAAAPDQPLGDPLKASPTKVFEAFINNLDRAGRDETTTFNYAKYSQRFIKFFPHRNLGSITRDDVERWRDWMLTLHRQQKGFQHKTLSAKYVTEHINWLAAVYNHWNLPNPTKNVVRPRITHSEEILRLRYFSKEEMKSLFENVSDELRPAFTFLSFTGCRIGELLGLKNAASDLNTEKQIIWVTGKGSKRRQLQLSGSAQPAWDAIQAEIQRRKVQPGDYIFDQYERWVDKRLRALCKACGLPERGPHTLRHTFATHALMFWHWDISFLAKWLGHDLLITFRTYGHFIPQTPPEIGY